MTLLIEEAVIVVIGFVSTWRSAISWWFVATLTLVVVIANTPDRFGNFTFSLASAIPISAISGGLLAIALLLTQRRKIGAQL